AKRVEEEKRKKEEEAKRLAEEKKKIEEEKKRKEAEQKRLAEEKKKKAAEAKRKKEEERKKRIAAEKRKQREAEEALLAQQLAEEDSALKARRLAGMLGQYRLRIKQRVKSKWLQPGSLTGQKCKVEVKQTRSGSILDVSVRPSVTCSPEMQSSVQKAVERSDPLPRAGSPEIFQRDLIFYFCTPDIQEEQCG
ncbi:MAG TPA: TonB C-terminal domain-containing protein, partial [Thiotrichales bacterium]|nr:TonB C-terminal domain-containing protein [Thiotrichales bacterium]